MGNAALRYFEDFAVGDKFESPSLTITEAAIVDFALTWDPQPFHIDAEFAKGWAFGGLIASGLHTMSASLRLWLALGVFQHCSLGSPGLDNVRFVRPVRPGDTIRTVTEILELKELGSKPDRGLSRIRQITYNQRNEAVLSMETAIFLKRRPA